MHRFALRQAKRNKDNRTATLTSWDAMLAGAMHTHMVQWCRSDTNRCKLTFLSVPSRAAHIVEPPDGTLNAYMELHVHSADRPPSDLPDLQPELDDGVGSQLLQPNPTVSAPPELNFLRIVHAAPYKQHLVRKTAQYEDMLVTVHMGLFEKTTAVGEQHEVTALPVGPNQAFSSVLSLSTIHCDPGDVRVWTHGDARFYLRGYETNLSENHVLAVTALVRAGAWGTARRTLDEVKDEPFTELPQLERTGEVELVADTALTRSWRLLVPEKVLMSYPLSDPKLLFDIDAQENIWQLTLFELLSALKNEGWSVAEAPCPTRRKPSFDCQTMLPKVLYPPQSGLPNRYYLLALMKAEDLSKAGVHNIEHGSTQKYYRGLLAQVGMDVGPQKKNRMPAELLEIDDGGGNMQQGSSLGKMSVEVSDVDLGSVPSSAEELAELGSDGF